ncbi:MAG TPA: phosphoribosylamine--glycine ligase [Candidatus Subteraquimicrobiales bacterium]
MKILVIGSGGREHALAWKISQSPLVKKIYCAPGNAGIIELAECVDLNPNNLKSLAEFAQEKKVDLTVVGPEAPLVDGVVNEFESRDLKIFGPRQEAAQIEGSKIFAKEIMKKCGVPTGWAKSFNDYGEAKKYAESQRTPFVVKADGLAAGKGVVVCFDEETALKALEDCFVHGKFGKGGQKVLIEEYLHGDELSVLCLTDGETVLPMAPAQDYKRVDDDDKGPNTGGMGSYSPVPSVSKEISDQIVTQILEPTIEGLAKEGKKYQGVLYAGIILTEEGPKVLEFNVRFGDPETQALLPRLESDLVEVMLRVAEGNLEDVNLKWTADDCVAVVLSSRGYPESYRTGFRIKGLKEVRDPKVQVFHAGTTLSQGEVATAGGRVLSVSALGKTFEEARRHAYAAIQKIHFEGMHYRKDIALRAAKHEVGLAVNHRAIQDFRDSQSSWLDF